MFKERLQSHYANLFLYTPSLIAPVLFMCLFGLIMSIQCVQWYNQHRTRQPYGKTTIPLFVACIFELVGLVNRILCHNDKTYLITFIVQNLFLLLAPPILAASIYMSYGRFLRLTNTPSFIISQQNITRFFVWGDVVSFGIQGTGGGFTANTKRFIQDIGNYIVVGGIGVQIIIFGFFIVSMIKTIMTLQQQQENKFNWKFFFFVLLTSSICIFVRCIFRIVESVGGKYGVVQRHEWTLYVFDVAVTWLACAVVVIFDVARYLSKIFDEMHEIEDESYKL